ncbi:TetR/AcrR family transcriptional regulator [Nocardia camponoti]|uniref:TetR family transcriptional regulator n=1 Tax=Nocardia camponoti TaxID=1616106 RepID=A0A917QPC4_9NOCA|nr:TetR/AcrR family transcriptional regulator [Nocardia camponoti]GGK61595.1 TetR family transcriptional regulator [Nocardia camponoti]
MSTVETFLARIQATPSTERDQVLDSALSAFLDFGIKRTSMGEIARRAAISPATLYRRYESKNDLVTAVAIREAHHLVTAVDERVRAVSDPAEQLVEMFVAFVSASARNPLLSRLLATEPEIVLPRLTTEAAPMLAVGREYIAAKLREHELVSDPDVVAEVFARLALSLALTPDGLIPLDDAEAGRTFARTLLPLVGFP